MSRRPFGGDVASFVVTIGAASAALIANRNAVVTMWSAATGGSQYTDLKAADGVTSITSVTAGADGLLPQFFGPDGVAQLWANAPGAAERVLLLSTDAGSAYKRVQQPLTVVLLGCSISNQDSVAGPTYIDRTVNGNVTGGSAQGFLAWANAFLGHRLDVISNAGVSGQNTTQVLARVQSDVIALNPGWCIVEGGIVNAVTQGLSYAQIISDLAAMYVRLQAAGVGVIACTATPTSYANTTGMRQILRRVNNWIRVYARLTGGIVLCDWAAAVTDPTTGDPFTGWFRTEVDGGHVHPNAIAARRLGQALANALDPVLPRVSMLPESSLDPDNLLLNGRLTGTTGTNSSGGTMTGTVPTSWSLFSADGGAGTIATLSQPARSGLAFPAMRADAALVPGNAFQIQCTAGNVGELHLHQQATTGFAVGDLVVAEIEFGTLNDWTGGITPPFLQVVWNGAAGSHNVLFRASSDDNFADSAAMGGVLRTKPIPVPAGVTGIRFTFGFKVATGTIWFDRAALYNLTAMGLTDG